LAIQLVLLHVHLLDSAKAGCFKRPDAEAAVNYLISIQPKKQPK